MKSYKQVDLFHDISGFSRVIFFKDFLEEKSIRALKTNFIN